MNFVLGARGRLGSAIVASREAAPSVVLERADYQDWWRRSGADAAARFLSARRGDDGVVYVAAGLIAPGADAEDHDRVNFRLARNTVVGAARAGLRSVTFGTVMETVVGASPSDPYIASKVRLGDFVHALPPESGALHLRLHTLYGGPPPNQFMFLGQLYSALAHGSEFRMSPGTQLREYHHVDDEVPAMQRLIESGSRGVVDLSHGFPVALRDLALYVFEQFKRPDLLRVGALPGPTIDNYSRVFEPPTALRGARFRDTLPGVVAYLRLCHATLGECG